MIIVRKRPYRSDPLDGHVVASGFEPYVHIRIYCDTLNLVNFTPGNRYRKDRG